MHSSHEITNNVIEAKRMNEQQRVFIERSVVCLVPNVETEHFNWSQFHAFRISNNKLDFN